MGLDGALWSRCCAQSLQSCPTLCNPVDRSPPASSVYGIIQARILEWVAISFSRGLNRPSNWTYISYVSCIGSGFFTTRASRCFDFILSATGSTKELLCFVWGREGYVNILFVFLKKKKKDCSDCNVKNTLEEGKNGYRKSKRMLSDPDKRSWIVPYSGVLDEVDRKWWIWKVLVR